MEQAAVRLLAGREHSRAELWRKLRARSYAGETVEEVLDELTRRRLLSDGRFAEQYCAMRQRRGFGPVRIRGELRERGVDDALIRDCLEAPWEEWRETLRRVHDKKFGAEPPEDLKERARRSRFLGYRGFSAEQIKELFSEYST